MAKSSILVGLEIGTSKTVMVVGETHPNGSLSIIGVGQVPSAGVRKGEIFDESMVRSCVRDAWQLAQDQAEADIARVFLSVTGEHFIGESHMGSYRLPDNENVIEPEHVQTAEENAFAYGNDLEASGRAVVNRELGGYSIDGREPTCSPAGLCGRTLDVNCHFVHGVKSRIQNSLHCVRNVPLDVDDIVFAPIATAQVMLGPSQKENGALLIDIGGGTTDYVCYMNGELVASGCIPVGGNTINNDIMSAMQGHCTFRAAEILKCVEGNAFGDRQDTSLAQYRDDKGMHEVSIPRGRLNELICARLWDTLGAVKAAVPKEVWGPNNLQVYLSGGTSLMRGLDELAMKMFRKPVNQPALPDEETPQILSDPRYCTAVGLVRYAQRCIESSREADPGFCRRIFNAIFGMFGN